MKIVNHLEAKEGDGIAASQQEIKDIEAKPISQKQPVEYYQKLARFLNTALNQALKELKEEPATEPKFSLLGGIEPFIDLFKNTLAQINVNTNSLAVQHYNLTIIMFERSKNITSLSKLKISFFVEPNPLIDEDTSACKDDLIKMLVMKSNKPRQLYDEAATQLSLSIQTYLAIDAKSLSSEDRSRILVIAQTYLSLPSVNVDIITLDRILAYLDKTINYSKDLDHHWNLTLICLSKLLSCKIPPSWEEKYLARLNSLLAIIDESEFNYDFASIYKGLVDRHLLKNEFQLAEDLRATTIEVLKKSNQPKMIEYYETTLKKTIADKKLAHLNTSSKIPTFMHSNAIKLPSLTVNKILIEQPTTNACYTKQMR